MCVSYNSGFEGRFDFSLLQQDPVDLSEEGMGLDGLLAALAHHAAQTLRRVLGHELHTQTIHVVFERTLANKHPAPFKALIRHFSISMLIIEPRH